MLGGMALERAVGGALSHADLVGLVVRQSALVDRLQAALAEQQALIARLEARIRELERELKQRDRDDPSTKMPGLKSAATPRRRKGGPRERRAHGFSRPRAQPTERVAHAAAACPRCNTPLGGGWVAWRKQVLEVPRVPARAIEHVYLVRRCPNPACRAQVGRASCRER